MPQDNRHPVLDPGERTLIARFAFREDAERAADALREAGFDVVSVGSAPDDPTDGAPIAEWGRLGYHPAALDDKWTAAANWYAGATWNEAALVTAVVPAEAAERARAVLERAGGRL
ncbi:MAG: hypothetical protein K6V97_11615 [Actinomycetia bacterium]|jgi:hypothetical protein|nr:hypothetical protein [Actinomycetes bacterium]